MLWEVSNKRGSFFEKNVWLSNKRGSFFEKIAWLSNKRGSFFKKTFGSVINGDLNNKSAPFLPQPEPNQQNQPRFYRSHGQINKNQPRFYRSHGQINNKSAPLLPQPWPNQQKSAPLLPQPWPNQQKSAPLLPQPKSMPDCLPGLAKIVRILFRWLVTFCN